MGLGQGEGEGEGEGWGESGARGQGAVRGDGLRGGAPAWLRVRVRVRVPAVGARLLGALLATLLGIGLLVGAQVGL